MELPVQLATTPLKAYISKKWKGQEVLNLFPKIQSFLIQRLGIEFKWFFASPKITISLNREKVIVWEAVLGEESQAISLKELSKIQNRSVEYQLAINRVNTVKTLVTSINASSNATKEEKEWAGLIQTCIKDVLEQHFFWYEGNLIATSWGVAPKSEFVIPESDPAPFSYDGFYPNNSPTPPLGTSESPPSIDVNPKPEVVVDPIREGILDYNFQGVTPQPDIQNPAPSTPEENQDSSDGTSEDTSSIADPGVAEGLPRIPSNDTNATTPDHTEDLARASADPSQYHGLGSSSENQDTSYKDNAPQTTKPRLIPFFDRREAWIYIVILIIIIITTVFITRSCATEVEILPPNPNVVLPIDSVDIVFDQDSIRKIVKNRLNIAAKDKQTRVEDLALAFKLAYPSDTYAITYYDTATCHIQVTVPEGELYQIREEIPAKLAQFRPLVWLETVYQFEALPSDPAFPDNTKSWFPKAIKADAYWEVSYGTPTVKIAVLDDGFDLTHPELKDQAITTWNAVERITDVFTNPRSTHGTHVAGIALARRDNRVGLAGIAPDCKLIPIQVGDRNGNISGTAVTNAILFAVRNEADVINLSLGMEINPRVASYPVGVQQDIINSSFLHEAVFWDELFQFADQNGITIVLAGGNSNMLIGLDPMQRSDYAIKVSAVDQKLSKASFSNFGKYSTVSAPGVAIYSAIPGNKYDYFQGTSMAAPVVSGAVALLKSVKPNLKPFEIRQILVKSGRPLGKSIGPLVQLDKALAFLQQVEEDLPNQDSTIPTDGLSNNRPIPNDPNARGNDLLTPDDPRLPYNPFDPPEPWQPVDPEFNPDPDFIPTPENCTDIEAQIDSLLQEIERLREKCYGIPHPDTMEMPQDIEDLSFAFGRWKSSTSIHNDELEEITIFFDFFPSETGVITLVEPSGQNCTADLVLEASGSAMLVDQPLPAGCNPGPGRYNNYSFSCQADAKGQAECIAQNKVIPANRFTFKLIKIQ